MTDHDEPTEQGAQDFENFEDFEAFTRFYERVSELRRSRGDTWGGPPYTAEEYEHARRGDHEAP